MKKKVNTPDDGSYWISSWGDPDKKPVNMKWGIREEWCQTPGKDKFQVL